MSDQLPKIYNFQNTEKRIYQWWEESGYFKPNNDPQKPGFNPNIKPFVISIPPPNVTGILHIGHVIFVTLEDLMIRYHRMKGEPTLWVPGTDHAGIATQLQVERLLRSEGKSREEVGRDEFLRRAWEWKEKHGGLITKQIRRIGASCDWDRERFTLDEGLSKAVREAFVTLYEKGLIYRGPRLINWSPGLKTAVSDLEVEYVEEPGTLYYFKYPLADGSGDYIPVATTRPETILGDTAVAVHPEDDRYKKYVGKTVLVPMLNREIPVIADEYVDREFGTAALKITPAHDPHDYEIGEKHNLAMITIMDKNACINENGGAYHGLDRFDCRKKLWADMKEAGLVIKEEPYTLKVPRSQRGGEIIEPLISTQWFVKIESLGKKALDVVKSGEIKIIPERFTKTYFNWMENLQDWCISRQLWWGHRIPVWYCQDCGAVLAKKEDPTECDKCGSTNLEQDPDVLDTWFSSGLWPFSTLGWPEKTKDLDYFYPTSVLETGYDILFFWVARMIMSGLEFTESIPFHTVYLHGLIRDEHGQKMSKSKNNVIDPLTVMEEMGTDSLRFTMLVGSTPGNDTNLSLKKVEANRNFANKIWNAGRFIINTIEKAPKSAQGKPEWSLADQWIWNRTQQMIKDVSQMYEDYQFGEAGRQLYEFFWSEFADWYVEIAKLQMQHGGDRAFYTAKRLINILDIILRLLHPFIPFITEELWGHLKNSAEKHSSEFSLFEKWEEALIIAQWPENEKGWQLDESILSDFSLVQGIIRTIRNARAEKIVQPGKRIPAIIVPQKNAVEIVEKQKETISSLGYLLEEELRIEQTAPTNKDGLVSLVESGTEIFLSLANLVDKDEELKRLSKEKSEIESQINRLEKLLNSPFAKKAPAAVVDKEKQKLETYQQSLIKLEKQIKDL